MSKAIMNWDLIIRVIVWNSFEKPDNILVDYNDINGRITDFDFVVGDWGTSGAERDHFGGTPMYASPNTFQDSSVKDLFAFGRFAAELYFAKQGRK